MLPSSLTTQSPPYTGTLQHVGSLVSLSLQRLGIEGDALRLTIDHLQTELGAIASTFEG